METLAYCTTESEEIALNKRKHFLLQVSNIAISFGVEEDIVLKLYAETQYNLFEYNGCSTLPKNVSVNDMTIEFLIWEIVRTKLELVKAEAQSLTDTLTGLANRRAFDAEMSKRAKQYSRSVFLDPKSSDPDNFSLIFFDLDYFKSINDSFGHPIGDEVLKKVASVALCHIRPNDILFRYGGEEFAILVYGEMNTAYTLAERIRKSIEEINVEKLGIDLNIRTNVTASFGVNQYMWLGDSEQSVEMFITNTDVLLYTAKESGRNKTVNSEYF